MSRQIAKRMSNRRENGRRIVGTILFHSLRYRMFHVGASLFQAPLSPSYFFCSITRGTGSKSSVVLSVTLDGCTRLLVSARLSCGLSVLASRIPLRSFSSCPCLSLFCKL